jgi:lipopolysaccharide/colanic/teichoic acid biosynthesis glycosyltransferase
MTCTMLRPPGLSGLVEEYAAAEDLPAPEWLVRLQLERPREGIRCLDFRSRLTKRTFDIVVSLALLVGLAPVMLLIAFLVWLSSPGPVIFCQVRTGLNLRAQRRERRAKCSALVAGGTRRERRLRRSDRRCAAAYGRPFVLYKFRTMCIDAETAGAQFAVRGDPRVTPLGRFLRRARLDELPQLWNVLKGEMSLVGPRPERPQFMEQLSREIPGYLRRLGLKPGLTGLAQIINGYDNHTESFRRKVALDLLYLQNCCLWNDVKIMIRTIGVVLSGRGAI